MKGKVRILLKQAWFLRPYPVRLDGVTIGVLTAKNPEIIHQVHPGRYELSIRYHGKWVAYPLEIQEENGVIYLHVHDNCLRFRRPTSIGSFVQIFFSLYCLIFLIGVYRYNWGFWASLPLLGWLLWEGIHGQPVQSSLQIKKFNPTSN